MIQPISDHAAKQIGTAQERAVCRRGSAQYKMIAAAGSRMPAVQHEFLGAQARLARIFIERGGVGNQLLPIRGRMHVYFNDAGIGSYFDLPETWIVGRRVAFHHYRHFEMRGGIFNGGQQIDIVFGHLQGWHEDVQSSVAGFHA